MMAKFIVGMAIVGFSTLCGYLLAKKYRQRKRFLSQMSVFNERFLSEIAYYKSPLREFASKYVYNGEFDAFLESYFQNLQEVYGREPFDFSAFTFLTKEEQSFITDYFFMLGKGDSASQKSYFSGAKDTLKRLENEAQTDYKKYGDLYIKLGFLCGLFILILII